MTEIQRIVAWIEDSYGKIHINEKRATASIAIYKGVLTGEADVWTNAVRDLFEKIHADPREGWQKLFPRRFKDEAVLDAFMAKLRKAIKRAEYYRQLRRPKGGDVS